MATAKSKGTAKAPALDSSAAVDAFMRTLEHPFRTEIELLREILLGAYPTFADGIQWNVPSFRTSSYFATIALRREGRIGLIFRLGAKVREWIRHV